MECPQCKNSVPVNESQYGALFTCPKCMAVYFINFDGLADFGEMTLESPAETEPQPASEPQTAQATEPSENFEDMFVSPPVDTEIFSPEANPSLFSLAANEITEYANQEQIISQISYDLCVKGLDSKEVRYAFKDAIDDSKFSWHTEDIMNEIKNGESELKNLNPVQAYVLATRLQFLDLEIDWKQNVAF